MKGIKYACAKLINGVLIGVLLLSTVTATSSLMSAPTQALLGNPLGEILPVEAPSLTSPVDGSSYRADSLPVQQSWTGMPNATSYVYESYISNPETGDATVYETDPTPQTTRSIDKKTPEGTYWWRVKAKSLTSESAWSSVRSFTIDNSKPATTHDLPAVVGRTLTVTQAIDDESPKEGSLTFTKLDTGAQYVTTLEQVNENYQIIYQLDTQGQLFGDGDYEADFFARDKAGNESHTTFVFELDTTAPEITVEDPEDALSGQTITISGTVAEQVTDIFVTIDSIGYPAVVNEGAWSVDIDTSSLAIGTYDVSVTAMDAAGNLGTAATTLTITGVAPVQNGIDLQGRELPNLPEDLRAPLLIAGLPLIISPSSNNVEPEPEETTAEEDDPPGDVAGANADTGTLSSFAQAVDTDATDGSLWGLDWYWWLLIIGGVVAGTGWIVALFRRGGGGA